MPVLTYKYRLFPNSTQAAGLTDMLGSFCDLYNACLQQRIEAYQRRGKSLGYIDQVNELKAVRLTDERLAGYSYSAEQQVVRRLDKSFKAFFDWVQAGQGRFSPLPGESMFDGADFRVGDGLTIRKSKKLGIVGIPGEIKVRWHRDLPTGAKVGAAALRSCGKWYICFSVETPDTYGPHPLRGCGRHRRRIDQPDRHVGRRHRTNAEVGQDRSKNSVVFSVLLPDASGEASVGSRRSGTLPGTAPALSISGGLHAQTVPHACRYYSHIAFEDLNITGLARGMLGPSPSSMPHGAN